MVDKYKSVDVIEDDRQFGFGEIWKVRDELISLLPTDRVQVKRHVHPCRLIVITQNCEENNNKYFPLIRVAPLAHDIKFREKFDILLNKGIDTTGADKTCMLQLQLEQPMLKKDLYEKIGDISDDKKFEVIALKAELMGLDLEGEEEDESSDNNTKIG